MRTEREQRLIDNEFPVEITLRSRRTRTTVGLAEMEAAMERSATYLGADVLTVKECVTAFIATIMLDFGGHGEVVQKSIEEASDGH